MSIYTLDGSLLNNAYNISGNQSNAYRLDGVKVFPDVITLKVMTYNVGQWYLGNHDNVPSELDQVYYNLQNGIIQRNDPDVLLLEEYTKQFSKSGRTALSMLQQYFPYIHEQADNSVTSGLNRCICSKYPISNYTVRPFNDASNLYYDSCTIMVNDIPIFVVVTHLHWATENVLRIEEINKIIALVKDQPYFIFGGDLNTNCKSVTDAPFIEIIKPLIDEGFHLANNDGVNFRVTYSDMPDAEVYKCLDNIVTSQNMTFTDIYVDTTKLTDQILEKVDHMPLIATLQIGGTS